MKFKKTIFTALLTLLISGLSFTASSQPQTIKSKTKGKKITLFNGKDLTGWEFQIRDASVDPKSVFTVQNNVIHISGNPFGYMRTKNEYSNYQLHAEYRWAAEPSNSGIFIHTQLPDTIWPDCFECQLAAGNAGDFICMGGVTMNEQSDRTKRVIKKTGASSEKQPGEWNIVEIECKGENIDVYINGIHQNKGTGTSVSSGHICLQSEGKDIEFRNVYLLKIK